MGCNPDPNELKLRYIYINLILAPNIEYGRFYNDNIQNYTREKST